jgi:hypothetical protein
MSKDGDSKSSDLTGGDGGFLTRWSARKTQIAEGLEVPEEALDDAALVADGADHQAAENDEDAALSDAELLEKYELPDPAEIEEEAGLDKFFDGKTPERLRQMALRRLWRINPFFGFVDDMVEYGEDYTDAATVIEGMQTAYQAGKGYLKQLIESDKDDENLEESISPIDQDAQADQELESDVEQQKSEAENQIDAGAEDPETSDQEAEKIPTGTSHADNTPLERDAAVKNLLDDKGLDEVSCLESSVFDDGNKNVAKTTEKSEAPMKPKRMQFRVNS